MYIGEVLDIKKENEQLKQENENLKDILKQKECTTMFPNECHCAFRCLGNEWCDEAENRFIKYKKKLGKIKELAKENCSCTRCEDFNCCDGCEDENYRRILQIIEEGE